MCIYGLFWQQLGILDPPLHPPRKDLLVLSQSGGGEFPSEPSGTLLAVERLLLVTTLGVFGLSVLVFQGVRLFHYGEHQVRCPGQIFFPCGVYYIPA